MIALRNPATGHEVRTDDSSADFWLAAGYRDESKKKGSAKKAAPAKKSEK